MCEVLGLDQGWWNIAGIVIEIAGFMLLFRPTLAEIGERNRVEFFGPRKIDVTKLILQPADRQKELDAKNERARRPLLLGASLVLFGLVLQIPGNWPGCS